MTKECPLTLKNDLVLRAAQGEKTERPPVWLMRQAGRFDPAYLEIRQRADLPLEALFRHPDLAAEISVLPKRFGVDAIIFFQDILTPLAPMGARFVFRPGPVLEPAVSDLSDLQNLRLFDPATELSFVSHTLKQITHTLDNELPILGFAGAPLTLAFFLVEGKSPHPNPARTLSLLRSSPQEFHKLLGKLSEMTAEYLKYQVECGVHAVQLFESAADLLTPKEYEEFALPYQQRVLAALKGHAPTILFAKDWPDIELMAKSGANVLSVGPGVDLASARRQLGDRVALQGNVDSSLLANGSLEDVEQAVTACVHAGRRHGHILNLGHGILPKTPVENVVRFIETAKSSGDVDCAASIASEMP